MLRHTDLLDRLRDGLASPPLRLDLSMLGRSLLSEFLLSAWHWLPPLGCEGQLNAAGMEAGGLGLRISGRGRWPVHPATSAAILSAIAAGFVQGRMADFGGLGPHRGTLAKKMAVWRVSEWLAATLEMWCRETGCGFESHALRSIDEYIFAFAFL